MTLPENRPVVKLCDFEPGRPYLALRVSAWNLSLFRLWESAQTRLGEEIDSTALESPRRPHISGSVSGKGRVDDQNNLAVLDAKDTESESLRVILRNSSVSPRGFDWQKQYRDATESLPNNPGQAVLDYLRGEYERFTRRSPTAAVWFFEDDPTHWQLECEVESSTFESIAAAVADGSCTTLSVTVKLAPWLLRNKWGGPVYMPEYDKLTFGIMRVGPAAGANFGWLEQLSWKQEQSNQLRRSARRQQRAFSQIVARVEVLVRDVKRYATWAFSSLRR
jgi:hypothetical protein